VIDVGWKAMASVGGASTIRVALAVLPGRPAEDVIAPVVFVYVPPWPGPLTVTGNEQDQPMKRLPPLRLIVSPPVVVSVPPQTLLVPSATVSPAGNVSVKASPVRSVLLTSGLYRVNVSVVVPLIRMLERLKAIPMVGEMRAVMLAVADAPVPPSIELTGSVVLVQTPWAAAVTLTEKVQLAPGSSDAPLRATSDELGTAVIVPAPQEPVSPAGVATTRPPGNGSESAIPVSVVTAFGFEIVKVRLVEVPCSIIATPNDLTTVGGAATSMVAVAVLPGTPLAELTALVVVV
jgi:hypothetical protein